MGIQATSPPTSPLHKMSPYLKRKHDPACLDFIEANEVVEPKKICIELVCSASTTATSATPSENGHKEENKENEVSLKETSTDSSSTSLSTASQSSTTTVTATQGGQLSPSKTAELLLTPKPERKVCDVVENPKVIVEHQPLPSIYDLRQMTCDDVYDDSGLSDDDSSEEESSECDDDEEDDDDDVRPSPIFEPVLRGTGTAKPIVTPSPPTPKSIYNGGDRFWSQNSFSMNAPTPPPPGSPLPPSATPVAMNGNATFHFLENNNQRIECAENGKSYLQLGTMSHHHHHHHHHLPVTPVIQPKPNMVYRRPIPPFRNPMLPVQPARPVCDHSNCLMRKTSLCYKSLRSRMLNLSLHKLHMARQNHEGSLRRSVLICNMLRYIEDETEKETVQDSHQFVQAAAVVAPQPPPPQPINHIDTDQYWPPPATNVGIGISGNEEQQQQHYAGSQNGLVSAYGVVGSCGSSNCVASGSHCGMMAGQPSGSNVSNGLNDSYETTLKDFNSAFRSTPYSSPVHPGMEVDSGLGSGDEDRGINWGSVLSLSSQSELDPLNNNSFTTDTWQTSSSGSGSGSDSLDISGHSGFDDISWKLSADEVLKTFPNEDGLFSVGPV